MKKTICKFKINSMLLNDTPEEKSYTLTATPVVDGSDENKQFFAATPSGELNLSVVNPMALEGLQTGDEIFITLEKAPEAAVASSDAETNG